LQGSLSVILWQQIRVFLLLHDQHVLSHTTKKPQQPTSLQEKLDSFNKKRQNEHRGMKACKIWPFPVSSTEQLELMPEDTAEQPCSACTGAAGKERNSSVNRSDKERLLQLCSHHFMRRSD